MKRPDQQAILGLLIVAALLSVGGLILVGLDRTVPPEVWALVAAALGAVGGWVGKTMTAETPEPEPDRIPAPLPPMEPARRVDVDATRTPAVYPLPEPVGQE